MSKDDLVNGDDILCNTSDSLPRQQWRVFIAQNPVLTTSPALHQKLTCSPPKPCTGVHQKGCDLEGVEGATPPTPNHSFKTMTTFNTDYSNTELLAQELNDEELQEVNGGILILAVPFIIGEIEKASNT